MRGKLGLKIFFIGLVICLSSCGQKEQKAKELQRRTIKVNKIQRRPMQKTLTVSGVLKAVQAIPIVCQTSGLVSKMNFRDGAFVKKGDLLIQLDDRATKARVQQCRAVVLEKKASADRQKALFQKKVSSVSALEKAQAEWETAKADLARAEVEDSYHAIYAPFDGYIGFCELSVGSPVRQNEELTRLVSKKMLVEFNLTESDAKLVKAGQEVSVLVEGLDNLPVECKLMAIEPYSNPVSHTVRILAEIDNREEKFRDGAFARVTIDLYRQASVLVVPQEAVGEDEGQSCVFKVEKNARPGPDGKPLSYVIAVPVHFGVRQSGFVELLDTNPESEIKGGLKEGDIIAVDPVDLLRNESIVTIENSVQ